jgi:hypothetical protein
LTYDGNQLTGFHQPLEDPTYLLIGVGADRIGP